MKALVLNCTLKRSPETSNTEALARVAMAELERAGVETEIVRLVDLDIKPGVKSDEGDGDEWPGVREKVVASEMLIVATPTWMGQMSSIAKRVLERLDALLYETDGENRTPAMGKVAGVVVTGNEDGAHHIVATVAQGLIDVGFTVPGAAWTYWHLGPGPGPDYTDTRQAHEWSDTVARNAARNLLHAARALAAAGPFPPQESAST
jgi:multimeric flavodoxin WrbA